MKQHRHGDVILTAATLPKGALREERNGDVVLAYGEVTGHAHRIATKKVSLWSKDDQRYIVVDETAELSHEEHGVHIVAPGTYKVSIQRVYTLGGDVRAVAD